MFLLKFFFPQKDILGKWRTVSKADTNEEEWLLDTSFFFLFY